MYCVLWRSALIYWSYLSELPVAVVTEASRLVLGEARGALHVWKVFATPIKEKHEVENNQGRHHAAGVLIMLCYTCLSHV